MNWQQRSLDRSLAGHTERSLNKGKRLLMAAKAIVGKSQKMNFTVREVVNHSGLSLRSFYQHFKSKEDLLLALFEEIIEDIAVKAKKKITSMPSKTKTDHSQRLQYLVYRFYSEQGAFPTPTGLQIQNLNSASSEQIREALEPLLVLFTEVIADAQTKNVVRSGDPRQHALYLLLVLMMHTQTRGNGLMADPWPIMSQEQLWMYCQSALAP